MPGQFTFSVPPEGLSEEEFLKWKDGAEIKINENLEDQNFLIPHYKDMYGLLESFESELLNRSEEFEKKIQEAKTEGWDGINSTVEELVARTKQLTEFLMAVRHSKDKNARNAEEKFEKLLNDANWMETYTYQDYLDGK